MKIGIFVAAVAASVLAHDACALPLVMKLDVAARPATLTAEQVMSGAPLSMPARLGTQTVVGAPVSPAAGMISLAAHSADNNTRLYAFVADGVLQSADIYGATGHLRMVNFSGQDFWVPAASTYSGRTLPVAEPQVPTKAAAAASLPAAVAAPGPDGNYEVRLLILYTPLTATRLGSSHAVEVEGQRLTELANAYYATNHVPVHLTLTRVAGYGGTDEAQDFYANRDSMVGNAAVTALRDQTASDLVVLFRTQDQGTLCGLSTVFDGADHSDPPLDVNPERDAFSVVAAAPTADDSSSCGADTMAHEIGHSFSAGHDWASVLGMSNVYWKPYAHALACAGNTTVSYFSLMWGNGAGPGGGRGDVITNPDALLDGQACGSAGVDGVEASQANNVRAMTEAAPYVAAYRSDSRSATGGADASNSGEGVGGGAMGGLPQLIGLVLLRLLSRRCSPRQRR